MGRDVTIPVLALVLLASGGLGMLGARCLLRLGRGMAVAVSLVVLGGYGLIVLWRPGVPVVPDFSVVLVGCCLGFLFGRFLGSTASVLAFLTTAAIVDLLSFSHGLTARILEAYRTNGSEILRSLAVFVELGGREYAVVGVSDIAILTAAYLGLALATGSKWEPGLWLLAGLLAAFLVGVFSGGAPGMPFMATAAWAFVARRRWIRRGSGLPRQGNRADRRR